MANKQEIEKLLDEIGGILSRVMPEGYGFGLVIFNFGEGGEMFYASNTEREDMIKMFRELIAKMETEGEC